MAKAAEAALIDAATARALADGGSISALTALLP